MNAAKARGGRDRSRPSRTGKVLAEGREEDFATRSPETSDDDGKPGSYARKPSEFTWKDWKAILKRTVTELGADSVSLIAAGVAFYAMLALFPAIAAVMTLYGFFNDPATIESHLGTLQRLIPPEAFVLIEDQVREIAKGGTTTLGIASLFSLALAVWSSKAGVSALMNGLNIVYDEDDERGFIWALLVALMLTVVMIVVAVIAFGIVVAAPVLFDLLAFGAFGEWLAAIIRWPLGLATVVFGIGLLYRFGPSRADAAFSWVSWGAIIAGLIWLVASGLFSFYVANFGSYNETYGSLGAVVALMMWFWISAFIVLLGAELNAEMEHQTRADTTTGPDKPMGQRGAYVADNPPPE